MNKKEKCSYPHNKIWRNERCPECSEKMPDNHCCDSYFESNERYNDRSDWKNNEGKYNDFKG